MLCISWQSNPKGHEVVVASADKDFFQLINTHISLLNPNDKSETLWQDDQVIAKTGVPPAQIIDWLSLVGDAVDGIPGVPGVGPKTAAKLLTEHQTIEQLYANLDQITSDKLRGKLAESAEDVRRNQELVALKTMAQWDVPLSDLVPTQRNEEALRDYYQRWNFRSRLSALDEFDFIK